MARSFYRPFTKWLELPLNSSSTVTLTDSKGNGLPCNFVSMECGAGDSALPNSFVTLHASSLAAEVIGANNGWLASGTLGVMCPAAGGVAQLVLGLDSVSSIGVVTSGTDVSAILTYGNVMVGNTLKDNQRPRGE